MSQTYRRNLRTTFEEIIKREAVFCSDGLENTSPYKERIEELAEKLADAAISVKKEVFLLKNAGLEWSILAGQDVEQEQIDSVVSGKEATDSFERELHFNLLPWDSTKEWEKLRKFVVKEYSKDSVVWSKYHQWRKAEGQYKGAMTNPRIYGNPSEFMAASFPAFLSYTSIYESKTPERAIHHADTNETKSIPNPYNPAEVKRRILAAGSGTFGQGLGTG